MAFGYAFEMMNRNAFLSPTFLTTGTVLTTLVLSARNPSLYLQQPYNLRTSNQSECPSCEMTFKYAQTRVVWVSRNMLLSIFSKNSTTFSTLKNTAQRMIRKLDPDSKLRDLLVGRHCDDPLPESHLNELTII
ncbi:hypothetical protein TNCV_2263611 [Trichonephila clavipes]|nr:hypothetical protein TNCV_2263611 [Trichonephila clavipes]